MTRLHLLAVAAFLLTLLVFATGCVVPSSPEVMHRWQAPPVLIEVTQSPGLSIDTYLAVPHLVLYADGRLIATRRLNYPRNPALDQTTLSMAQICSLLSDIEADGFFDLSASRDYIPPKVTDQNTTYITVMAWRTQKLSAYALDMVANGGSFANNPDRVGARVPSALARTYSRLWNYRPWSLKEYRPERVALKIGTRTGPTTQMPLWPSTSPSLADLAERRQGDWWTTFLEGQQAQTVIVNLGDKWRETSLLEGGQAYYVDLFPLVPLQVLNPDDRYPAAYSYPLTPTVELQCPGR